MNPAMPLTTNDSDLIRSNTSAMLVHAYRVRALRPIVRRAAKRLEGGELRSWTLRRLIEQHFDVRVGAHSYGPCLTPGAFPPDVTVGRYVSIAPGVRVFRRNHPFERLTMHPYFYNAKMGVVENDTIESNPLWIGHDSWIGADAIITPGCCEIGIGAVIGAGAIVTKDVPAFAIVGDRKSVV